MLMMIYITSFKKYKYINQKTLLNEVKKAVDGHYNRSAGNVKPTGEITCSFSDMPRCASNSSCMHAVHSQHAG